MGNPLNKLGARSLKDFHGIREAYVDTETGLLITYFRKRIDGEAIRTVFRLREVAQLEPEGAKYKNPDLNHLVVIGPSIKPEAEKLAQQEMQQDDSVDIKLVVRPKTPRNQSA